MTSVETAQMQAAMTPPVDDDTNENILDIEAKKTKVSETYAINDTKDLDSVQARLKEKFLDADVIIKKASLTFKVNMQANPTEKTPAKIVSFAETYKIEETRDLDAFIDAAKTKLADEDLLLKNASVAFKMDIEAV
jgi:hypothetical protein